MHTTQLSLARPCTTTHHASKRRAAVWSALLSVLILTAAVVAPRVDAASHQQTPTGELIAAMTQSELDKCRSLGGEVYAAYKKAGASDATAAAEAQRATQLCVDKIAKKPKLPK